MAVWFFFKLFFHYVSLAFSLYGFFLVYLQLFNLLTFHLTEVLETKGNKKLMRSVTTGRLFLACTGQVDPFVNECLYHKCKY